MWFLYLVSTCSYYVPLLSSLRPALAASPTLNGCCASGLLSCLAINPCDLLPGECDYRAVGWNQNCNLPSWHELPTATISLAVCGHVSILRGQKYVCH